MKLVLVFLVGVLIGVGGVFLPNLLRHARGALRSTGSTSTSRRLHTEKTFEFVANAPMEIAAPLFGADKERVWANGWNPEFVWPALDAPQKDQQGMVFTVPHGHSNAVWLNSQFDLAAGRVQYAYVIPGTMATLITLTLTPRQNGTHVKVQYDRTALATDANPLVEKMAAADAVAGPEWQQQINAYLQTHQSR